MFTKEDIYSLKYFIGFAAVAICFFVYSGVTGWKWVGGVKTEKEKTNSTSNRGVRYYRFYHK